MPNESKTSDTRRIRLKTPNSRIAIRAPISNREMTAATTATHTSVDVMAADSLLSEVITTTA